MEERKLATDKSVFYHNVPTRLWMDKKCDRRLSDFLGGYDSAKNPTALSLRLQKDEYPLMFGTKDSQNLNSSQNFIQLKP